MCVTSGINQNVSSRVSWDRTNQAAMSDLALGHLSSQAAEGVSLALCLTNMSDLKKK